jgi:hypothetical protein
MDVDYCQVGGRNMYHVQSSMTTSYDGDFSGTVRKWEWEDRSPFFFAKENSLKRSLSPSLHLNNV